MSQSERGKKTFESQAAAVNSWAKYYRDALPQGNMIIEPQLGSQPSSLSPMTLDVSEVLGPRETIVAKTNDEERPFPDFAPPKKRETSTKKEEKKDLEDDETRRQIEQLESDGAPPLKSGD